MHVNETNLGSSTPFPTCDPTLSAKLGTFCQVDPGHTLAVHDVSNIYHVPLILVEQGIHTIIRNGLSLTGMSEEPDLVAWTAMARGVDAVEETVKIAMVGKYTALSDAYLSVTKALTHCGYVRTAATFC